MTNTFPQNDQRVYRSDKEEVLMRLRLAPRVPLALLLLVVALSSAACEPEKKEFGDKINVDKPDENGEVVAGVIPNPDQMFVALHNLGKPDWKSVVKPIEVKATYSDKSQAALVEGMLLADFFVFVHAKDKKQTKSLVEDMVKVAKVLDVKIPKKTVKQVKKDISAGEWGDLRQSIDDLNIKLQEQVIEEEKRPDLAYLISLGAWLEGAYVASKVISKDYKKRTAVMLRQGSLIDDIQKASKVLKKKDKYGHKVVKKLGKMKKLMKVKSGVAVSEAKSKKIYELAKSTRTDILE